MHNETRTNQSISIDKLEMHAFITIWLFFGIVLEIVMLILTILEYTTTNNGSTLLLIVALSSSIAAIIGKVLLLKWHRIGFYILLATSLFTTIFYAIYTKGEYIQIGPIIGSCVMYAILNIKCNDIPYWEAMKIKNHSITTP